MEPSPDLIKAVVEGHGMPGIQINHPGIISKAIHILLNIPSSFMNPSQLDDIAKLSKHDTFSRMTKTDN